MAHISQVKLDNNIKYATDSSAYCETAGGTAAKVASCPGYVLRGGNWIQVIMTTANTASSALTLNINGTGAKPIYINGKASGSGNTTLPSGSYHVRYDGANYQFRTDGVLPGSATDISYDENSLIKDTDPYLYRQTPTPTKNFFLEQNLIGASVAWNQLVKNSISDTTSSDVTFKGSNGIYSAVGLASGTALAVITNASIANHVYFIGISNATNTMIWLLGFADDATNTAKIIKKNSTNAFGLLVLNGTNVNETNLIPQIIDLTQLFGTQIADHIYTLEQATAGSGIAWLKSYGFITKDYYAYDSGSLQSVNVSGRKIVGKNLFDENSVTKNKGLNQTGGLFNSDTYAVSDFIMIPPNTTFYLSNVAGSASGVTSCFYDSNKEFISTAFIYGGGGQFVSGTVTSPSNATYMRVGTNTNNYEGVTVVSIGSTATAYEPYTSHTYPTSPIDLRGLFKLSNGNLVADGDVYSADGGVKRKYGVVDLGTLTYTKDTAVTGVDRYSVPISDIKAVSVASTVGNAICSKYPIVSISEANNNGMTNVFTVFSSTVYFYTATGTYSDESAFKSALQNANAQLVYELASPTSDSAIPYQNPQLGGVTEEWVDSAVASSERDVAIPVGGERYYMTMTQAMHNFSAVSYTLGTDSNNITLTTEKEVQSIVAPYAESSDKVKQTATTADNDYRILFSGTADNVTRSETTRKNWALTFNPTKIAVTLGQRSGNLTVGNYSFASGWSADASGGGSFAIGSNAVASGGVAFAQGSNVTASGNASVAVGSASEATGDVSFARGSGAVASGDYSYADGLNTTASGDYSHAEGNYALASGVISHAEGFHTIAQRANNHVFGAFNIADTGGSGTTFQGTYIEIVGNGTADNERSNARTLDWDGNEWIANSLTVGLNSSGTVGAFSFRQGLTNIASGSMSSAMGDSTHATGRSSHSEGYSTIASGNNSHSEGYSTTASGGESHSEGYNTTASGDQSHAEGVNTTASGTVSHAEGVGTIAQRSYNHVFGKYNVADTGGSSGNNGTYIEIVGNGNGINERSNARTLDWSGNETLAGNLVLSGTTSDITLTGSNNTWDGTNTSLKTAIAAAGQGGGNVTQTASDSEIDYYELLFSSTADNTTRTESTRKAQSLLYNPNSKELRITNSDNSSITKITNGALEVNYTGSNHTSARVELDISSAAVGDGFTGTVQLNDTTGKNMLIGSKDILLLGTDNTWDGTNTSLKSAIAALVSALNS